MSTLSHNLRGRDTELGLLHARLGGAIDGRGGVVVVSGEAGIGKSALAQAVAGEAQRLKFRVLSGRAWELADAPAYFPVRGGLRALGVTPAIPAVSRADAFGLWEDVLEALARESARTPLYWLLEDLHAADAQTIELLAFLAQPLRALRALIVATVRTGDPRATGAVLQRLTGLVREGERIALDRLGESDVAALAAQVGGRALAAGAIDAWMARTGGNPLFVVECARAVRAGLRVESALPETVVQVVWERLRALSATTREFLEQGAVLGRDFASAMVARLGGRLPAVVIDGLLPALRAGLLEETAPGRFRFPHALVRDAIEEAMPAPARRACHARAEAALAGEGDGPDVLAARAHHAIKGLGGGPGESPDVVSEPRAGEVVARAVAALEAEAARDRAFALWQRWLASKAAPPDAQAHLELARLATAAGNHGEARRAGEAASALAKRAQDPAGVARAALAQGANLRPAIRDAALVRTLEDALAGLSGGQEPRLGCLLRARLAAAMQPAADPQVPLAMAREAIAFARQRGDEALLREVLFVGGSALVYYADAHETHAIAGELLTLSLAAGDQARALRAYTRRIVGHLELGDFASFDLDADRMLALARAVGHPSLAWCPLLIESMRALARGNLEESERFVTEVEQMAALCDDPALTLSLFAHKAHRTLMLDDESGMRAALAGVMAQVGGAAGDFGALIQAGFAVRLEDRAAAAAQIPALLRLARQAPPDSPTLGMVGAAVALAGSAEQRADMFARLLPLDGRELHTGHVPYTYEGPVARVLGLLEASLGLTDAADTRLEAARVRCRALGLRPWVARLSWERGRVLLERGRTGPARALLEEAAAQAAELGMVAVEARARRALGADRDPAAAAPPAARDDGLAPLSLAREGEIWRVSWAGRVARVRDSRGVQLLARLAASPGEPIHALALAADSDAFVPESDAGEALDVKAVAAYRARLGTIEDQLAAAESAGDGARVERYRREREALGAEISRAVGLGGRLRKVGSATERARVNVTRRLKDAVARIAEADAEIGRHLEAVVRTGTYCLCRATAERDGRGSAARNEVFPRK